MTSRWARTVPLTRCPREGELSAEIRVHHPVPEQTPQTQEGPQLTGALTCSPADQLSIKSLFTQAPLQSHHSRRWRGRGQQESTQSVFFRNNDLSRAERSSQSVIYVICVIWWELEKKLFCTMMLKSERRCDSQFRWSWWKKRFEFKTLNFIDRIIHQIMFQLVGQMWR